MMPCPVIPGWLGERTKVKLILAVHDMPTEHAQLVLLSSSHLSHGEEVMSLAGPSPML